MKKVLVQAWIFSILSFGLLSCGNKNEKMQNDFKEKAKTNPQLSTITATANDGVLTLTGQCPDETCKTNAELAAREVKDVKSVVNNIRVTPNATVVIASDEVIKNAVDEVIDDYDDVEATVVNGEVTLRGKSPANLQKLMMDLHATGAKKINNQLTIK